MDRDKVLRALSKLDITISQPCYATKLFSYDEEGRMRIDKVEPGNNFEQGVVVQVNYRNDGGCPNSDGTYVSEDFDWDEDSDIEEFIKTLKQGFALSEEEVRFFFEFTQLHLPEDRLLKIFEAPLEEFLSHSNHNVRQAGLTLLNDKSD